MTAIRREQRSTNGTGLFLVTLGAGLVVLALRYLDWYSAADGATAADTAGEVTFQSLRAGVAQAGGAGMASAYFDWLAVTLLVGVAVAGWLANAPWVAADALRVTGFACGFLGAGTTWYALRQHVNATGSAHSVFFHSTLGMWAALGGFAVAAAGAVLGPRHD